MRFAKKLDIIVTFVESGVAIVPMPIASTLFGEAPTTNLNDLREHYQQHRSEPYGIATGSTSGIVVIRVDGDTGRASLRALKRKYRGTLPKTVTMQMGKCRYYFFRTGGRPIRSSDGLLGKGIDVYGDNDWVLGPGSIDASGARFRFVEGHTLREIKFALWPKWLRELKRLQLAPSASSLPAATVKPWTAPVQLNFEFPVPAPPNVTMFVSLKAAWGNASDAVRERFIMEVLEWPGKR